MGRASSSENPSGGRTRLVLQVVLLWATLACFFRLVSEQGASFALLFICFCVAFSLGLLATLVQIFAARITAEKNHDLRSLSQTLFLSLFMTSMATVSIPAAVNAWQTPFSLLSVKGVSILVMGLLAITSTIGFAVMAKRVFRARCCTPPSCDSEVHGEI